MFKILVAEDESSFRRLIAGVLRKAGYDILEVADGEEALAAFENNYVDMLITDVMMPKMSGQELLGAIRKVNDKIPVLFLTALDNIIPRRTHL